MKLEVVLAALATSLQVSALPSGNAKYSPPMINGPQNVSPSNVNAGYLPPIKPIVSPSNENALYLPPIVSPSNGRNRNPKKCSPPPPCPTSNAVAASGNTGTVQPGQPNFGNGNGNPPANGLQGALPASTTTGPPTPSQ